MPSSRSIRTSPAASVTTLSPANPHPAISGVTTTGSASRRERPGREEEIAQW